MPRQLIFALLASLPLTLGGCSDRFEPIRHRGTLVVAVEPGMPGLVGVGEQMCGYQKEMLRAYADKIGVDIEMVTCDPSRRGEMMRRGEADMVVYTSRLADERSDGQHLLCTSAYTLLGPATAAYNIAVGRLSLQAALRGSNILVSSGFLDTKGFTELLDALKGGKISVSDDDGFRLFEQLYYNGFDFLVCETSEAVIGCALSGAGQMVRICDFDSCIPFYVRVNPALPGVADHFRQWLGKYRGSPQLAGLNERFFTLGNVGQYIGRRNFTPSLDISYYDDIMREAGRREGEDWRLLAAIAFTESRFNLFAGSSRGARGMMQVLPSVAHSYDVLGKDIINPRMNVMAGAKLLHDIRRALRFDSKTPERERLSFILASYNAGLTRIMTARTAVTAEKGGDPDSWDEVLRYMRHHSDREDQIAFDGTETVGYIDKVLAKYEWYKQKTKR